MARDFVSASTEYIDIGNVVQVSLPLSIFSWVNPDDNTSVTTISGSYSATNSHNGFKQYISSASNAALQFGDNTGGGASDRRSAVSTNTISTSVWSSFGGWINGAADMKIVLNGTNETLSYSGTGGAMAYSSGNGAIGKYNDSEYYDGRVCHAAVWSVKLSDNSLFALSRGANPFVVEHGSLVGYFPLDGNDSPEQNYYDQNPTGTLTGTTKHASNPPVELIENYL